MLNHRRIIWEMRVDNPEAPPLVLNSAADVARTMLAIGARDREREQITVFLLNGAKECLGIETVSQGTAEMTATNPREVFRAAVAANAPAVIVCHNHPDGNPSPSNADMETTASMTNAGAILGIVLYDHVIVAAGSREYFSFREDSKGGPDN